MGPGKWRVRGLQKLLRERNSSVIWIFHFCSKVLLRKIFVNNRVWYRLYNSRADLPHAPEFHSLFGRPVVVKVARVCSHGGLTPRIASGTQGVWPCLR